MTSPTSRSDDSLMRDIAHGDTAAFEALYARHVRRALSVARAQGAQRELADEIVQDAFVALWRRAGQYRPDRGSVATWLGTIVRNRAADAWRRAGARPVLVSDLAAPDTVAAAESEGATVDRLMLHDLVRALPSEQREAIALSYYGGLTHEQISVSSGAPLGTVKGRLRLGLGRLRLATA